MKKSHPTLDKMTLGKAAMTTTLALALFLPAVPRALAQDDEDGSFEGQFLLGVRSVSVGGAERKYREDVDLDDGARLFDFNFELVPGKELRGIVDRVELDVHNFGGDPFESFRLAASKAGSYKLRFDRRESNYFYEDVILPPELASIPQSSGGDFHHFDIDRVQDSAQLDVTLSPRAKAFFGFDRITRRGESTTTLDLQRDEFELDKPVDESLDDYRGGFEYSWAKVTLAIESRVRDYENAFELFLPGFSLGENPAPNSSSLDFFFLDQPYDLESTEQTVRVIARPRKGLLITGTAILQDLELTAEATETSQGVDFAGRPFSTDLEGGGEVERDARLFDLDVVWTLNPRLAVVGSVSRRDLDQEGTFEFGTSDSAGLWDIETSGVEGGVQFSFSSDLTLAVGLRFEERDVTFGAAQDAPLETHDESTSQDGYYATLGWRPVKDLRLTLDYEDSSYDDPFTTASPTAAQRLRLAGNWKLASGFSLVGSYLLRRIDNDDSGWQADTDQLNLRLAWQHGGLSASLGYGFIELDRSIVQAVSTGAIFPIAYTADADFVDGRLHWQDDRWGVGVDCRLYDNGGSFALERTDLRGFAEVALVRGYRLRLGYRTIDYDEERFDFDDYDADILELGLGYRW